MKSNPGRPRSTEKERRIKKSTLALMKLHGYADLSIEKIARHANVGKPTIYRRWKHMGELVYDSVFSDFHIHPPKSTGNLEIDLHTFIQSIDSKMRDPVATSALLGLADQFQRDLELQKKIFRTWLLPVRDALISLFKNATDDDGLLSQPGEETMGLIMDLIAGTIFFRYAVIKMPVSKKDISILTSLVIKGVK